MISLLPPKYHIFSVGLSDFRTGQDLPFNGCFNGRLSPDGAVSSENEASDLLIVIR